MTKIVCWIQDKRRTEAEQNGGKDGKELYKLMNSAVKTM